MFTVYKYICIYNYLKSCSNASFEAFELKTTKLKKSALFGRFLFWNRIPTWKFKRKTKYFTAMAGGPFCWTGATK